MGNFVFGQPEEEKAPALGFQYQPNQPVTYGPLKDGAAGISVGWPTDVLDPDTIDCIISDPDADIPPLFDLPAQVDIHWQDTLRNYKAELANDEDFVKRTQGFLAYSYAALQALYKTACGKQVIDFFVQGTTGVGINPASRGNSVAGAASVPAFAPLAKKLLDRAARFNTDSDGLIALAHRRFAGNDEDASLAAMATFMNQQPLYSLFQAPPYEFAEHGFLAAKFPIRGENLKDWFSNGDNSEFANLLQNGLDIQINDVSTHAYTRLMAVVALEPNLAAGTGSPSNVRFNVLKTEMNRDRPAAIGLGHELIHAYWAANGRQLGYELFEPSTLLFEMKCVGLGPWVDSDISENRLRAQWSRANRVAVARRDVYDLAEPDDDLGRQKIRQQSRTI